MDRLCALARQYELLGGRFDEIADIGADHGYLAKKLLDLGFSGKMIVTDIAPKPLEVAKQNIGMHPRVEYRLCDGLSGDFRNTGLFFIAGMGGELIAEMLKTSRQIRDDAVFVLQPMTHFGKLIDALGVSRLWSYFASERGKHYRILTASGHFPAWRPDREESSFVTIPLVREFLEDAPGTERVLRENLKEAIEFFEASLIRQRHISLSMEKSSDLLLRRICEDRRNKLESVIGTLKGEYNGICSN